MKTSTFAIENFRSSGEQFLKILIDDLRAQGVVVDSLICDHLCFRVETEDEYQSYKSTLAKNGRLLTEAQVNGRAISTFRLDQPFKVESHEVKLVELPSPKSGTIYKTGFEHAEFVIEESFSSFSSKFPNLQFVSSNHSVLNPELSLKIDSDRQVKFHHLSLDRVIELEEALIKDIIFDLDGTLIQSRENIYEINRIVFSNVLGREVSLGEAKDKFHSEFSKLFEAFEVTCSKKQSEAVSNWGKVAESFSYELFEGAKDILDWLKEKGITMHLWTARDENSARKILRHHDMESHFSTLSFATLKDSKPNPKSLGFDWKSLNKNEFLVIGDSPSDIKGARNIKAISCAALWDPHSNRDSLHSSGAEIFFHEMSDFRDWLSKVTKPKEIERYGSVRPQVGVASVVDTGLC